MSSMLRLRVIAFIIDLLIMNCSYFVITYSLKLIATNLSNINEKSISTSIFYIYFLGCLILIPARTLGMKICKVSFKYLNDKSQYFLWAIVKFYFFQLFFLGVGFYSLLFVLTGKRGLIQFGILGILISLLDLAPILMKKRYVFLHDKLSGLEIKKDLK